MANFKFKPGDTVLINGDVYQSANGTLKSKKLENYKATIKKIAEKGAHPYAIEGMWGWFDEGSFKVYVEPPKFEIGDKVKLIKNETYKHVPIKLSKNVVYEILEINEDKIRIGSLNMKYTVSAFNLKKV